MYRKKERSLDNIENFELLPGTKLSSENRWVIMAELIPWDDFEEEYAKQFKVEKGAPAKPFRMALGALIIKEQLGITDRETVEQIKENPYLQYFIGLEVYTFEPSFEASMMVHFRQRITMKLVNQINEEMVKRGREKTEQKEEKSSSDSEEIGERENKGQLILDATCAPADIKYPTDLDILNQARKAVEIIIDLLYFTLRGKLNRKPRTYRKNARKEYLKIAKKRRPSHQERREVIKKQLKYIKRNLSHVEKLIKAGAKLESLNKRQQNSLLVIKKVYNQQLEMWEKKTQISWENFNESRDLKAQVEKCKETYGCYPKSVHVDQIYRNKENRAWCKKRGIRISGPPLGRPPKNVSQEQKKQALEDESFRNAIEGKFGQAKRRFGLNLVMTKLRETSETSIAITFLVVNLSKLLRQFLKLFLSLFLQGRTKELNLCFYFNKNYVKSHLSIAKLMILEDNY